MFAHSRLNLISTFAYFMVLEMYRVSINAAGLHPDFGAKTAQEALRDLQEEEEMGEVDLNLKEYKERRNKARQSPFPSIVIEVRATPPIEFGSGSPPQSQQPKKAQPSVPATSKDDLERLEALFGMSAAKKPPVSSQEDEAVDFYDSIGKVRKQKHLFIHFELLSCCQTQTP